jgi:hypothetical protein
MSPTMAFISRRLCRDAGIGDKACDGISSRQSATTRCHYVCESSISGSGSIYGLYMYRYVDVYVFFKEKNYKNFLSFPTAASPMKQVVSETDILIHKVHEHNRSPLTLQNGG